jgi:hypothetical protein
VASDFLVSHVRRQFDLITAKYGGSPRIALFANGRHTEWLLGVLGEERSRAIACILDDRATPDETLGDVPIVRPSAASLQEFDVLVPSSDTVEEDLAAKARSLFGDTVEVWSLYRDVTPGPYPKGKGIVTEGKGK